MMEAAFERVPRERIYEITGLQFLQFNTLYQLLAHAADELAAAGRGRDPADDARPVRLAVHRPPRRRAHRRLDDPAARPPRRPLVGRALQRPGPAPRDPPRADRAGDGGRPAAGVGGRGAGHPRPADGDRPRHARHRERRGGRADGVDGRTRPTGATSARGRGRCWASRCPGRSSTRRRSGTTSRTRGAWRGRPGS